MHPVAGRGNWLTTSMAGGATEGAGGTGGGDGADAFGATSHGASVKATSDVAPSEATMCTLTSTS